MNIDWFLSPLGHSIGIDMISVGTLMSGILLTLLKNVNSCIILISYEKEVFEKILGISGP